MTGQDLDGDGKIESQDVEIVNKGLIRSFFSAIKEFFTIATADFSKNEIDAYEKTLKDANLEDAAEGLTDIVELVKTSGKKAAEDEIKETETVKKNKFIRGIVEKFFGKKKKNETKETENEVDVVVNDKTKNEEYDENEMKDVEVVN